MIVFRSMVVDTEARLAALMAQNEDAGPPFKMARGMRITSVGHLFRKFSIDDLPQLFKVVASTMALLGREASPPGEVSVYCPLAHRRLEAKPGLIGLWQVSGRRNLT